MIVCKKCGLIDDYYTELKNGQNTAFCLGCGAYIKNIPYAKQSFYFGKYKGKTVSDVDDIEYLIWFLNNVKTSPTMKDAVIQQIELLKK